MKKKIFIFYSLFFILISFKLSSQIVLTWHDDGTYAPNIPINATMISGQVWGAGGGGGGAEAVLSGTALGGGAGGGSFIQGEFPNSFDSCSIVVGKGGNGGGAAANGQVGGLSKIMFGTNEICAGGGAAGGGISKSIAAIESSSRGDYGLGGKYSSSSSIINAYGINGEDGSYGYFDYQFPANQGVGGSGGSGAGIDGGVGGTCDVNSNGGNGSIIGGGGAGGALYRAGFFSDSRIGGNGAKGKAILQFSLPRPSFSFSSSTICTGEEINVSISGNFIANTTYKLFLNGTEISSFNSQSTSFIPTVAGNYEIYAYYPNFYSDTDSVSFSSEYGISDNFAYVKSTNIVSLNINPNPIITSISSTEDYGYKGVGTAEITSDNESDQYFWNNGDIGAFIENLTAGEYCVTVVNISGCEVTNCVTVVGTPFSEIEDEYTNDGFSISPNPNNGEFTIDISNINNAKHYQIIDMKGSILKEENLEPGNMKYEISCNLPKGIYIVRVVALNNIYTQSMIIK